MLDSRTVIAMIASLGLAAGCQNSTESGAAIGAGSGALIGQAAGGNTKSTLIGAGVGALAGAVIGSEMDKERQRKEAEARRNSPVGHQNAEASRLAAENERLRMEIENERLRRELEAQRGDE